MKWLKKIRIQRLLSSIEEKVQHSILIKTETISVLSNLNKDYDSEKRTRDIETVNKELDKCFILAEKAISLEPYFGDPYAVRAGLFAHRGLTNKDGKSLRKAINDLESALKLGPLIETNRAKWNDQSKLYQIQYENLLHYGRFD